MDTASLFSLRGKVVLITGASSGLGERFSEVAAANGAAVVLVSRRQTALEAVKARIEAAGGFALVAAADVNDEGAMHAAFDVAEARFGAVTVLVANAGIPARAFPLDVQRSKWREVMDTDLDAVFFWSQEAARRMVSAKVPGSIITLASIAGMQTVARLTPYSVAKAAVIQATKLMALDFAKHQIRVNAIAPGYVATNMTRDFIASADGQAMQARLPLGRFGEPSDLDGAFLLLASDASRLITGTTLVVDSGHSLPNAVG